MCLEGDWVRILSIEQKSHRTSDMRGIDRMTAAADMRLMNHKIISSMRQTLFGYGDLEDIPYEQVMIIAQLQYHNH
jgi:hypothetical protein